MEMRRTMFVIKHGYRNPKEQSLPSFLSTNSVTELRMLGGCSAYFFVSNANNVARFVTYNTPFFATGVV